MPSLLLLLLLLLSPLALRAQEGDTTQPAPSPIDTAEREPVLTMTKDPMTAILLSIVPGGGQYYNRDYWKIPVFAGAAGWFVGRALYLHGQYRDIVDQMATISPDSSIYSAYKFRRESLRDDRDLNLAYFLMVEALGMIDAYVGAHLYDFTVDGFAAGLRISPIGLAFRLEW